MRNELQKKEVESVESIVSQKLRPVEQRIPEGEAFQQRLRLVMKDCARAHPMISTDEGIFGGIPHLREMRLSVGDILAQIYALGSITAVVNYYAPYISEEQVKEAVAYAQDFLETTCDPHQADG